MYINVYIHVWDCSGILRCNKLQMPWVQKRGSTPSQGIPSPNRFVDWATFGQSGVMSRVQAATLLVWIVKTCQEL